MNIRISSLLLLAILLWWTAPTHAQRKKKKAAPAPALSYPDSLFNTLEWRHIGPFRGGRSTTCTGVRSQPNTFYFGSAGGGIWKTTDAGVTWKNISDRHLRATSIGAIAVAESDPNVVYAGTGEACVRGVMTSHGDGIYKSTDAGKTWHHAGLDNTLHISAICVHPHNPDIVYVAALGSTYAPGPDRGIYKTTDGGTTWQKVHFVDNHSGVSDLVMDMNNPRILYAAFWDNQRTPWYIRSGGPGSGIWKTTDSGRTWKKLTNGLPEGVMGKTGLAVSRANPERLYAIIEAEDGGLYRSDDAGESWKLVNKERILRTRSWYYMHVFADPQDENVVYVLNAPFNKSIDGGKTFVQVPVPHGDNHDLWIHPDHPDILINSNDGGANISLNGGKTWSTQRNQPTAQIYRVNADNSYPYRLYGGQQDNTTLMIPAIAPGPGIDWQDWHADVGGGEAAHIAFDPDNPVYIYSTNITGFIDEYHLPTGRKKFVKPWPILDLGEPSDEMKYRYNWNPPVLVSQHDPAVIYYGSQVVHRSSDRALHWEEISPDLTRNDTAHLGLMGGPITNEAAGGEIYHTLMTLAESPHRAGVLWAGADDGLVHLTTDGGRTWHHVSPGPEGIINSIEVSPHREQTTYLTLMRYKFNDFRPYIYKTTDQGRTWQLITNGLPAGAYARVVRADPERDGLLYAGTERGLFVSFDDGAHWQPFQRNMPMVPVTDLKVHRGDLLAATHGRGFWILDDLSPLRQLSREVLTARAWLFAPRPAVTDNTYFRAEVSGQGTNPHPGAAIRYFLNKEESDSTELIIRIQNSEGEVLRTYSSTAEKKSAKVAAEPGLNTLYWDMRLAPIEVSAGVMPAGPEKELAGYRVAPGEYRVVLLYGSEEHSHPLTLLPDPRNPADAAQTAAREALLEQLYDGLTGLYRGLSDLQEVRQQINNLTERLAGDDEVKQQGREIIEKIDTMEEELISPRQETYQDIINYRNKLDRQLYNLLQIIDGNAPPLTGGEKELGRLLLEQWQQAKPRMERILKEDVGRFNDMLRQKGVPHIAPEQDEDTGKPTS